MGEIELHPLAGVDLRGRVVQDGSGVANARVRMTSDGRSATAPTTADGTFVLHNVSEGAQELSVTAYSGHRHQRQIEVPKGKR